MDLILWRHADAQDGFPDLARELTGKGHRQATDMAKWLKLHLPRDSEILASPAVRAQQTVQALTHEFKTVQEIGPGASYEAVISAARWPGHKGAVVVVGHQPTLGQAAAWLLSGEAVEWGIKKGAIWWLTNRARGERSAATVLRAAISPDLL
jgi:phosphohistidine phosphatase